MEKSVKIQRAAALTGALILVALFIAAYALYGKELFQFVSDTARFNACLLYTSEAETVPFDSMRGSIR